MDAFYIEVNKAASAASSDSYQGDDDQGDDYEYDGLEQPQAADAQSGVSSDEESWYIDQIMADEFGPDGVSLSGLAGGGTISGLVSSWAVRSANDLGEFLRSVTRRLGGVRM